MEILNKYIYNPETDLLGKGGFATVYKAYDKILEMDVALKFFHPQDQANKYTIINEIKKAIVLAHPNIVKYYGIETMVNRNFHGQEEQVQIGVMEYVQEGQMKVYLTNNPVPMFELSKLLIDVLEGLKYLHSQGIIHRDIKPQNILLARDKQNRLIAKIADFGISKAADANQASASLLLGTIEYMAPEQFNPEKYGINKKVGYNVDIWAFGATAYYLLTNELLFGSRSGDTSAANLINKIVHLEGFEGKLNQVEEPYRTFLSRCIVPNANDRTNDIDELIAILKGGDYSKSTRSTAIGSTPNKKAEFIAGDETRILPADTLKKEKPKKAAPKKKEVSANDETQIIENPFLVTEKAPVVEQSQANLEEPYPQKSNKNKIIGIVVTLLVLAGAAFFYFTNNSKESTQLSQEEIKMQFLQTMDSSFIPVPGGTYLMGSNDFENESPAHSVNIAPFKMMSHEVTRKFWAMVMNDKKYKADSILSDLPATNVSWNEVQVFLVKLNAITNKKYRLPSESEWEYVSNRGQIPANNLDEYSWNMKTANGFLHPIKTKKPDQHGFYDMYGNAYEWCEDWFGKYNQTPENKGKILRGGDYLNDIVFVSDKIRNLQAPDKSSLSIGFRLAVDTE